MSKVKKFFVMLVFCAAAFASLPGRLLAETVDFLPTYDQCMSWCMVDNDFFTCDKYCSKYPSEM